MNLSSEVILAAQAMEEFEICERSNTLSACLILLRKSDFAAATDIIQIYELTQKHKTLTLA